MTPYEVLGVAPEATAEEIRRAYLGLARRHHPDFYTAASPAERALAERRMQAVNEAWAVVGDEARRRAHDARHRAEPDEGATTFRPDDPTNDDADPRDQPDVPYRVQPPPSLARRIATIAPVALFAVAVGVGALGLVLVSAPMMGLSVALFVFSVLGFLVLPLLALSSAMKDEG